MSLPLEKIIAASLQLEPDRSAVLRDVHRAASLGITHIALNENMLELAMAEVNMAGLALKVTALVGFPIGQWNWQAKSVALEEFADVQNGPLAMMHGVGPWLDGSAQSAAEMAGFANITAEKWLVTSLSAISDDRLGKFADDVAGAGASMLILSNGVAASGLPAPNASKIKSMAKAAAGRFELCAMAPNGTDKAQILDWIESGADRVICADFWQLCARVPHAD